MTQYLLLVLSLSLSLGSPLSANPADDLDVLLGDLVGIESEMAENQTRIESLQSELQRVQTLGQQSASEIESLRVLAAEHATRVQQLGERYAQLLVLAQKQKADLEQATMWNYVWASAAATAALVAVLR